MKLYSIIDLTTPENVQSNAIKFTFGHFEFLSNFYLLPNKIEDEFGIKYSTTEAYYQASKSLNYISRKKFELMDAKQSKKAGKELKDIRPDWDIVKFEIMRRALELKFLDTNLARLLMNTTDYQLVEWTWWNDQCWGVYDKTGEGNNALGKLLMERRNLLFLKDIGDNYY